MLTPAYTRQFERDTKRMKKRGKNLDKLKIIIRSIVAQEPLDAIHRDHKLIGNWKGRRECHIESDWLLIYLVESDRVVFERTGTHSDLFQMQGDLCPTRRSRGTGRAVPLSQIFL